MAENSTYRRPDGKDAHGHLAKGQNGSAVVVIQEWWGVNDQIAESPIVSRRRLHRNRPRPLSRQARQVRRRSQPPDGQPRLGSGCLPGRRGRCGPPEDSHAKVAVMGFCRAARSRFSRHASSRDRCRRLLLRHSSGPGVRSLHDPDSHAVPLRRQGRLVQSRRRKRARGKAQTRQGRPRALSLPGQHAFFNETRLEVYDAAAAKQAWERTIAFLGTNLLAT